MTTFPQAVDRTAELTIPMPKTVTIHDQTSWPVRYKRTNKPRIRRMPFGIWLCTDGTESWGKGYTPAKAYTAWVRNNFLPAPS